jgi:hypothetical protein
MSRTAIARQWAVTWLREQAERLNPALNGMSRRDAERWASAAGMDDLGELVTAWLRGEIAQTPGHCGPPCGETIPLTGVLTLVNRAGFVTENSQRAGSRGARIWNAWVEGFASGGTVKRLREMTDGTELNIVACRSGAHEYDGSLIRHLAICPRRAVLGFWCDACPGAAAELAETWSVLVEDPEPGRNDRLWSALEAFAARAPRGAKEGTR